MDAGNDNTTFYSFVILGVLFDMHYLKYSVRLEETTYFKFELPYK